MYVLDGETDIQTGLDDLPSIDCLCDSLIVDDATSKGTGALLERHVQSVGAPTWTPLAPVNPNRFRLHLYTSDRGSDQAAMRNQMPHKLPPGATACSVLTNACLDHQSQLGDLQVLKCIDVKLKTFNLSWTYLSTNVKCCHAWRSNHRPFHFSILKSGPQAAADIASTIAPIVEAGKRGAVRLFEQKVKVVGTGALLNALQETIGIKHANVPVAKQARATAAGPTELAVEAMQAESGKLNRWERELLEGIGDDMWRIAFDISYKNSGPLSHLRNFMRKRFGDE